MVVVGINVCVPLKMFCWHVSITVPYLLNRVTQVFIKYIHILHYIQANIEKTNKRQTHKRNTHICVYMCV